MVTVALERGTKIVVLPSLKMAPNQPRDPAGSSTGGQWSAARGGGASDATLETTARAMFNSPSHQARSLNEDDLAPNIGGQADAYGLEHQTDGYIIKENPSIFMTGHTPSPELIQARENYAEAQSNPAILAVDAYTSYDHYYMNTILKEDPAIITELVKNGHSWGERPDGGFTREQVAENFALADAKSKTILVNAGLLTVDRPASMLASVEQSFIRSASHVKELHNVIENAPSFEPTMVFRGARAGITGPTIAEYEQAAKTGAIIQKNGFISTSLNTTTATNFSDANVNIISSQPARYHPAHIMEIVVTKGLVAKATIPVEQEVVLQHGSKFRVIAVVDKLTRNNVPIKAVQLVQVNDPSTKMAPNQPRDPAGSSTGGQWSAARGSGQGAGASQAAGTDLEAAARTMFGSQAYEAMGDMFSEYPRGTSGYGNEHQTAFEVMRQYGEYAGTGPQPPPTIPVLSNIPERLFQQEYRDAQNNPGALALAEYSGNGYHRINAVLKRDPEVLAKVVAEGHTWSPRPAGGYTEQDRETNIMASLAKAEPILQSFGRTAEMTVNGSPIAFHRQVEALTHAKEIHNVIEGAPTFAPTMVFRGVSAGISGPTLAEYSAAAASGGSVKLNGFVSTSISQQSALNFTSSRHNETFTGHDRAHPQYAMHIVTNKGLAIKNGMREQEILLQHGQSYKVIGVTQGSLDRTIPFNAFGNRIPIVQLVLEQPTSTKMAPNQPRNPAGSSTGGQWVSAAGAGQAGGESLEAVARRMFSKPMQASASPGVAAEAYGTKHQTTYNLRREVDNATQTDLAKHSQDLHLATNSPGSTAIDYYASGDYRSMNEPLRANPELLAKLVAQGHVWAPTPPAPAFSGNSLQDPQFRIDNVQKAAFKVREILVQEKIPNITLNTDPYNATIYSLAFAKPLHDVIQGAPSFEPTMVFRGVKAGIKGPTFAEYEAAAASGATLKMNGFISTSLNPSTAMKFGETFTTVGDAKSPRFHERYFTRIVTTEGLVVKAGMREQEILLQHGSKFKVIGTYKATAENEVNMVDVVLIN